MNSTPHTHQTEDVSEATKPTQTVSDLGDYVASLVAEVCELQQECDALRRELAAVQNVA